MVHEERNDALREEAWSAFALSLAPIVPTPAARERLLASLNGPERFTLYAEEVARVFGVAFDAARAALCLVQDPSAWRRSFLPGSFVMSTPALQRAKVVITRLPPGARIPMHPHSSRETTFVLDGVLLEDGTREHRAGAVLDMQAGTQHELEVAGGSDCLVVFFPAQL